jgi:hypothetical protein
MHLDSLLQLARYAAILGRAADAYSPGKFATHCCFSPQYASALAYPRYLSAAAMRAGIADADHLGAGCCRSLSNVRIAGALSNLGRVAARKHPLSRKPAHHINRTPHQPDSPSA